VKKATPVLIVFDHAQALVSAKLGRCPKCFRASATGAALGWLLEILVYFVWPSSVLQWIVLAWAVSFTVLWALHMVVFAIRALLLHKFEYSVDRGISLSRRQVIRVFAQGLTLGILASVAFPRPVLADIDCPACGQKDCSDSPISCGNGHCCPAGHRWLCTKSNCAQVVSGACYRSDFSSDVVALLRRCCDELIDCS